MSVTTEKKQTNVIPFNRSGDYFFKCGLVAYRRQKYDRALKHFERAIKLAPHEPVFHIQLAAVLSEIGDYERSNAILQQVLDDHGEIIAELHFFMANNYAYLGHFELAERAILRYIELGPNARFSQDAYELLEILQFEMEEDDWPELDHEESELISRHEEARYLLKNGEVERAIPLLRAIVSEFPHCWAAKNHLAEALFRQGDDEAFTICEHILAEDEGNLFAVCNLALFYTISGDTTRANRFIDSLKRVYPLDIDHYIKVATTLCALKQYEEAYKRLKRLDATLLEERPSLLYCLGVALYHLNERKKAMAYMKRAAALNDEQAIRFFEQKPSEVTFDIWSD